MTYGVPTSLARNALVVICAFLIGYGVMTLAIFLEINFSKGGEVFRSGGSAPPSAVSDAEAVFDATENSLIRFQFIYTPLALLLPACVVAFFSRGWDWAWLLVALGCSFGLVSVVLAFSNLGRGLLAGLVIYLIVAAIVTSKMYLRERNVVAEA